MIHFDFTVSDADAENIVQAVYNAAIGNKRKILDVMVRQDIAEDQKQAFIEYYERDEKYMLGLIKKMTNTRVEE